MYCSHIGVIAKKIKKTMYFSTTLKITHMDLIILVILTYEHSKLQREKMTLNCP